MSTGILAKEKQAYLEKNIVPLGISDDAGFELMAVSSVLISKSLRPHVIAFKDRNKKKYGIVRKIDYEDKSCDLDYDFPTSQPDFKPMLHQKLTTQFLVRKPKSMVLNATGSGKTLSTLWAADYLIKKEEIKRVLIVSPLTGVKSTWKRSLDEFFLNYSYQCLTDGSTPKRKAALIAMDNPFNIINHDGITALLKSGVINDQYDLVLYDESTAIKSVDSDRFKWFYKWTLDNPTMRVVLMTGTPIAHSQVDAFAPAKIIGSSVLKEYGIKTVGAWRNIVTRKVWKFQYEEVKETIPMCFKIMQPAICFAKRDCIDLPDFTYNNVRVTETAEQKKYINELKNGNFALVRDKHEILAANAAVLQTKLLQIWSGVVKDTEGNLVDIDASPRMEALLDILEASDTPVVVFTAYRGSQMKLHRYLTSKKLKGEIINGDITADQRANIIARFQNFEFDYLLAHPKTTAHSVDLTASNQIVYYTPIFSNELMLQSLDRIQRLSSMKYGYDKFTVYFLYASDLELAIFDKLKDKTLTQNVLLDLIREYLEV